MGVRVHNLRIKENGEDVIEMTDHVGAVTCMVWGNANGKANESDTFFTTGRDAVINTWLIQEEEREQTQGKKKKKKSGEPMEGKECFQKDYSIHLFPSDNLHHFQCHLPS